MKVAFLFLMVNDHKQSSLWEDFFRTADGNFNCSIYVNVKYPENIDSFLKRHIIPSNYTDTKWGSIGLVQAQIELYKEALKDDANTHFCLLSDSCIPLYNFNETVKRLSERGNSVYEFREQSVYSQMKQIVSKDISQNLVKHHQWIHLTRESVEVVVRNELRLKEFECLFCPDEKFIGTILKINKVHYNRIMTTNVTWIAGQMHPKSWNVLTEKDINYARARGSIFLRKVTNSLQVNKQHLLGSQH
ncbi:TPA_asm: glycosyltransferase [Monosiga MELD virus 2]|nr:TPA_asm: glycosyltransferase [Monosiga MELD virus 2]